VPCYIFNNCCVPFPPPAANEHDVGIVIISVNGLYATTKHMRRTRSYALQQQQHHPVAVVAPAIAAVTVVALAIAAAE
jgi:hypothetical protein